MPRTVSTLALVASGFLLLIILTLHILPFEPIVAYCVVFITASGLFLPVAYLLLKDGPPRSASSVLVFAALAVRLSFLLADPIGSDDAYRYLWDGRVQAAGINPYRFAPDAPQLQHLQSAALPSKVNHPHMKSLYFPLTQWFFFVAYSLSGEAIWGFKLILFLAESATLFALSLLVRRLSLGPHLVLLYALCPLPVFQFAVDAHLDALGLPFLAFGVLLYLNGKSTAALILLGLSAAVKPVSLVLLPLFFLNESGVRRRLLVLVVPAGILVLHFVPYFFSADPFEAFMQFARHWTFNGAVFETLNLYLHDNQRARLVSGIILGIALLLMYLRSRDFVQRVYYSVLLLLLFSPVVHPWYVAWLAVLLPIAGRWSGIVLAATTSFASLTVLTFIQTGLWEQSALVLVLEYLPVFLLLSLELVRSPARPGFVHSSAE
jgi:hypothetical protein